MTQALRLASLLELTRERICAAVRDPIPVQRAVRELGQHGVASNQCSEALRAGVIAPAKARAMFGQLMAMPPLCMPAEAFKALGVTTHSPHGTGSDMVREMASLGLPWSEPDARALGHWLRDRNAPKHEKPQADRVGARPQQPVHHAQVPLWLAM